MHNDTIRSCQEHEFGKLRRQRDRVRLLDHACHDFLVVVVDGGNTNKKGIISVMLTIRTKKHNKENPLGLQSYETNFTINGKKFAHSYIPHVIKNIRNCMSRPKHIFFKR